MPEAKIKKEKVFFIYPEGKQRFLRLFGDSQKTSGLRSGYVVLKPGESIGEHNTGPSEEVIYVAAGSGLVTYGKRGRVKIGKNAFIYIPPQTRHNVIGTGKSRLKYIYTASRVSGV